MTKDAYSYFTCLPTTDEQDFTEQTGCVLPTITAERSADCDKMSQAKQPQ